MNTTKILDSEINNLKISSLPSRPTAPTAFGGKGYTSAEMKAAFDKLSLFIIKRFNMLLDDVCKEGEGSLADDVPTGIYDGHTLRGLFSDIVSGDLPTYLSMGDESLSDMKARLDGKNASLEEEIALCILQLSDSITDASVPSARNLSTGEVEI